MEKHGEQLIELAHEVRAALVELDGNIDENFSGACALAAWLLVERARQRGIELKFVTSFHHAWCELGDGTVVDPTYSQFDEENDVWIGEATAMHKATERYCSDEDAEDVLRYNEAAWEFLAKWPNEQNPLHAQNRPRLEGWLNNVSDKNAHV